MKTTIFISALMAAAFLLPCAAKAQDETRERKTTDERNDTHWAHPLEIGAHLLPTFTTLKVRTYSGEEAEVEATGGLGYGGLLGINLFKNLGIQGEVNYQPISQKFKDRGLEQRVSINYLEIPMMLSLNTDKSRVVNFNVVLGPQFGLHLGSSVKTDGSAGESDSLRAVIAVKPGEVGAVYGAGFDFGLNPEKNIRFGIGFRGMYGLMNINAREEGNNTYNVLLEGARKSYGAYIGLKVAF